MKNKNVFFNQDKSNKLVQLAVKDDTIVTLYLFGSVAKGEARPNSDIDFAVLFDKELPEDEHLNKKLALMAEMSSVLGRDDIDLVVLNNAPPTLAYRVFKEGDLLYEAAGKKKQRVNFQVRVVNQYFDFLPSQKLLFQGLRTRIREGRFGGR